MMDVDGRCEGPTQVRVKKNVIGALNLPLTRVHSSRMRTVCCNGRLSCLTCPPQPHTPPPMHVPSTHAPCHAPPAMHAPAMHALPCGQNS